MKKIIFLLSIFTLVLTSCDPMADINSELNEDNPIVGETTFTMSDDDYADLEMDYTSFSSIDDAKTAIPNLLNDKFPVWGKGSLATVTFNFYKPNNINDDLGVYEVSDQDYSDLGFNYGNFSSPSHINTFCEWKYPDAVRGDFVELTYNYYTGQTTVQKTKKIILLDSWMETIEFSDDDYTAMGRLYPNFKYKDDAQHKIGIYLKTLLPYAFEGDQVITLYNWRHKVDGSYVMDVNVAPFTFDGANWNYIGSVIEQTIKFGHNGTVWEPDNTIVYTLTNADYALVGNGQYFNFDVRAGKDDETEEARIAKINTILLNNFPDALEGQKYLVKYAVYTGSAESWETKVILQDGEYVKFEE